MRFAAALGFVALVSPASAAVPTAGLFSPTYTPRPVTRFVAGDAVSPSTTLGVKTAPIPDAIVEDAFRSAIDPNGRRNLAINELAVGWEPARRTALEDLRDAQRRYAEASGGDAGTRLSSFVALLHLVVDESGRSVAHEPSSNGEAALDDTYSRVIRDMPDTALPRIKATEDAWRAYRDAFGRFAEAIDRADTAPTLRDLLAHQRAEELRPLADDR